MNWWLIIIPVISGFIGWVTNWVAIKMLFHPREPKKILGITFQGIFPKRQVQFAEKLGKVISNELISFGDIEEKVTDPNNLKRILPIVEDHIDHFLKAKLKEKMDAAGLESVLHYRSKPAKSGEDFEFIAKHFGLK